MDLKAEYLRITKEYWEKYNQHLDSVESLKAEYALKRDGYNAEINMINSECVTMRDEINQLYEFLISVGGALNQKITIFDFSKELYLPESSIKVTPKYEKPQYEDGDAWFDAGLKTIFRNKRNREMIESYEQAVQNEYLKFTKEINKRKSEKKFAQEAEGIAEIYRDTVIIVRDAIREKILPELELIKAFLYADAIREAAIDGDGFDHIKPNSIEEYRGTNHHVHYQFVKNTFDFYTLISDFFTKAILTNLINKRNVSSEDKKEFDHIVKNINDSVASLDAKRVLK